MGMLYNAIAIWARIVKRFSLLLYGKIVLQQMVEAFGYNDTRRTRRLEDKGGNVL